ncbi:hypothetical protein PIIN_02452 [Serendipita indica DSM 11827]|uniref:Uncharacterized protein n=1 Tax=Serendipita indica (strain DSM 11827) TaxID=1109443 RepID=G4TB93_SERID|nr:hypothetical protein PIIN_02452 [Serendipita indica DSM 11827]
MCGHFYTPSLGPAHNSAMEGSPSTRPASNLKLALDAYDAQQRRSAALQEAQRIGNLIHIQEQQLVAARHLAKQRKLALRRQQQQQQQQQQQLALSQSSPPTTVQCQPTLESLPECVVEEEDDEQGIYNSSLLAHPCSTLSAPGALVQPAAEPVAADSTQTTPRIRAEQPQSAPCVRPPVRFAAHRRRPQEPFATVWPRTHWKVRRARQCCIFKHSDWFPHAPVHPPALRLASPRFSEIVADRAQSNPVITIY